MMQTNNTTIMSKGQHLSLQERIEIQCMLSKDYSHRQIALEIGRSHATINNEIKRGTIEQKKKSMASLFISRYTKRILHKTTTKINVRNQENHLNY